MDQEKSNIVDLRTVAKPEQKDTPSSVHPQKLAWSAPEYEHHEKEFQWFLTAGIVAVSVILSLVILKNIFGAATLTLFAVIFYLYATRKPEQLTIEITGKGITINQKLIPHSSIVSFWVLYEPPIKDLIIIRKEHFIPKMTLPLGDANPVDVRNTLLAHALKEKEEEESLSDIVARRVGF